jgi:23S rRNA (uridine2552-2'-O)-methyltransferase
MLSGEPIPLRRSRAGYRLEQTERRQGLLHHGMLVLARGSAVDVLRWALDLATRVLKSTGSALIKVFQGAGFQEFVAGTRRQFKAVRFLKPEASRKRSAETQVLASGLRMV